MTTLDQSAGDGVARAPLWQRARLWMKRRSVSIYALTLTLILGFLAIAPAIFVEVPSGHVGVLWLRFFGGTVTDRVYSEGTHLIFPWDRVTMYDVRLRTDTRTYEAVAANGMSMTVDVSLRYRINPPAAGLVHKLAGSDYAEKLVHPEIASLVYEFVSQHKPENFYSVNRADIQGFLLREARQQFPVPPIDMQALKLAPGATAEDYASVMIRVEDVLVAGVSFPPLVRQAIDRKIEQQQIMEEYDFRITREIKERDRKRIEAEGVRDFQDIVARNITPEYLRLRGIEATRAFATSQNAKTIIIGGRDGLPVILNTGDDARTGTAAAASQETHTKEPAANGADEITARLSTLDAPPTENTAREAPPDTAGR
ncbi:prohibitin family protein [Roseomonas genomospecies 6]|uniref:Prohibitin family protein n=1 Tax=Roseomonas genomospecies 6 TaxID=214106 RepID=A0A9W7TYL2_9PROT|nr:prohibitin family protein [Roseomonas genomospecies 6]KAA0679996.1 prohibitin family protein [Roseomonas genomospecies 6]